MCLTTTQGQSAELYAGSRRQAPSLALKRTLSKNRKRKRLCQGLGESPYLNGTGCRVAPTMLALLLSSGGSCGLRMWSMWVQGSIRVRILLSKGASGN